MAGKTLVVPALLSVTGRGFSPLPTNLNEVETSSRASSVSDEEDEISKGEELTVLDGVKQMNDILNKQIDTLRLKIQVDEKNFDVTRNFLIQSKETEVERKDEQIDELKDSVISLNEQIRKLAKENEEKDKLIASKCAEIGELKILVRQTKECARKINRQVGRIKLEKEKLEADPKYQKQKEEIEMLNKELELLKQRLITVDQELDRANKIIEEQTEELKSYDHDRVVMHEKFQADLETATKSMNKEVERMREVMSQNSEEMKNIYQQNKAMQMDVIAIKEMLRTKNELAAKASTPTPVLPHAEMASFQTKALLKKPTPSQHVPREHYNKHSGSVTKSQTSKAGERVSLSASEQFGSDSPDASSRTVYPSQRILGPPQGIQQTATSIPILPPLYVNELQFQPGTRVRNKMVAGSSKINRKPNKK
uniref:Uncharacterized protein n=1 Tax=Biomphalaria glabrata TaxID=6526 RepID=A0A2C9L9L6_BIOGL